MRQRDAKNWMPAFRKIPRFRKVSGARCDSTGSHLAPVRTDVARCHLRESADPEAPVGQGQACRAAQPPLSAAALDVRFPAGMTRGGISFMTLILCKLLKRLKTARGARLYRVGMDLGFCWHGLGFGATPAWGADAGRFVGSGRPATADLPDEGARRLRICDSFVRLRL